MISSTRNTAPNLRNHAVSSLSLSLSLHQHRSAAVMEHGAAEAERDREDGGETKTGAESDRAGEQGEPEGAWRRGFDLTSPAGPQIHNYVRCRSSPSLAGRNHRQACVVPDANMGHQLAGGNSSWCPELESRTTHQSSLHEEPASSLSSSPPPAAEVCVRAREGGGGRRSGDFSKGLSAGCRAGDITSPKAARELSPRR